MPSEKRRGSGFERALSNVHYGLRALHAKTLTMSARRRQSLNSDSWMWWQSPSLPRSSKNLMCCKKVDNRALICPVCGSCPH